MKQSLCRWYLTIAVVLSICVSAHGAIYYVNFSTGLDTNNGTSTGTPWKHSPGDTNATGIPAGTTLAPGDTINFKGGVKYYGSITLINSGVLGNPITYQGQPTGWGVGKAIIDGSTPLTMSVCTGNGTGPGQVPNANFSSIHYGTMPVGADWTLPVFESDTWLDLTQTSTANPKPFFYADTEYFNAISGGITATSCTDATLFNQSDSAYWVGARILVHVSGNSVASAEITAFNTSTNTISYSSVGTPIAASNWDSKYHYAIVNSPRLLSAPGQYAIDSINGIVYVWPRANPAAITVGSRIFAFSTNSQSYTTIDGFVIQGQHGTTFLSGRGVNGSTSTATNGLVIQNCDFKNMNASSSTGVTYFKGAGTSPNVIQNCTFDHIYGRGPFVTGNSNAIKNNTITYLTGTCIYSQASTGVPNINGEISGNVIDHCRGVHQNAITIYGTVSDPAANWVVKNNTVLNFTQRYGNFGMSAQLHQNFLVYNNLFQADGGYAGDSFASGSSYFRFYNNTLSGTVRIFGMMFNTTAEFKNNICNGLTISDNGSSDPINWSRLTHSNNVYTSLHFQQDSNYATNVTVPWSFGAGEVQVNDTALFIAPGTDYHLKPTDLAAIDKGVDLTGFVVGDISGTPRPSGIAWDIGAYELVQSSPAILTQPAANLIAAASDTVNFSLLARGQAPLSYQWKKNGSNLTDGGIVSGANSATLTLTGISVSDAGTYTVDVNNALGPLVTSTNSVLTVGATAPSITTQPTASQSVTWGSTVTFTVAAIGLPAPTYQWQKDGVNLINGGIVSGATSATLTLTGVTGSYAGTYTVIADNNVPPSVTSGNSVLTVNGIPVAITSQPANQAVLLGNPVTFTVSATGTPTPTFQWNKNNVPIPGATGSNYTIGNSTANDAGSYSVTVSNIVGSVLSATATLVVSVVPVPNITSQPVALTVAAGRNVSFQIATVDAVSFQWQVSADGGTTWSNLSNDATYSGVTSKTLTIANAPLTLNGRLYRAQAGNGTGGATSNAVALGVTTPVFPSPASVVVSPTGNLLVSDRTQNVIQSVNAQRVANLLAGVANQQGSTNGNGNVALFRQPGGAVLDSAGNLYVADTGNSMIRKITPSGTVSTLAGSTSNQSYRDGNGTDAWFNSPSSVAIDGGGSLYVADTGNSVIRKIDPAGNVTTFAGTAGVRGSVDGNGPAARFNQPTGIAADTGGNLFVADTLNQVIRKISPNGAVSTLAGLTGVTGSADGTGADALFNNPLGVAVDNLGNIYVSDSGNATIRRISSAGVVTTYAGLPTISGLMDGTGLDTWFNQPMGLSMDSAGNLYVADNGNAAIRRISNGRVVNTLVITQGSTPIPAPPPTTPTTPTPTPPTNPTPTPSSGGGGGGAPSIWFIFTLVVLFAVRQRGRAIG